MRQSSPKWVIFIILLCVLTVYPPREVQASPDLASRITDSQNTWRFSTVSFWGEAVPHPFSSARSPEHRVQLILDRLVYVSPLRGYDIRASLIANNEINAFTDGKTIYLNTGLIQAFWGDDHAVASVVAHELSHIIANHKAVSQGSVWSNIWQVIRPLLGLNHYSALAGSAIGEAASLKRASYSRFQEKEADAISAILMSEAGFNPYGLSLFMQKSGSAPGWKLPKSMAIPTNFSSPTDLSQGLALNVLRASPFYRSHPGHQSREKTIQLMMRAKEASMTLGDLRTQDKKLADIYETVELHRPKNRDQSL